MARRTHCSMSVYFKEVRRFVYFTICLYNGQPTAIQQLSHCLTLRQDTGNRARGLRMQLSYMVAMALANPLHLFIPARGASLRHT